MGIRRLFGCLKIFESSNEVETGCLNIEVCCFDVAIYRFASVWSRSVGRKLDGERSLVLVLVVRRSMVDVDIGGRGVVKCASRDAGYL